MTFTFAFLPLIDTRLIIAAWVFGLVMLFPLLAARRWVSSLLRALLLSFLALAVAQPQLELNEERSLPTQVVVINDISGSQKESGRLTLMERASDHLVSTLKDQNLDVITQTLTTDDRRGGTHLAETLSASAGVWRKEQLGGVFIVSDGLVEDRPEQLASAVDLLDVPVHLLLTEQKEATDRRLVIDTLPRYIVTNKPISFRARVVDESGEGAINQGEPVRITVHLNGKVIWEGNTLVGQSQPFSLTLSQRGDNVVEIEVEPLEGEISTINNRVSIPLRGIGESLQVLLVSGNIYPGIRTWRDLLKSDPAIDLIHFTILRRQESVDATPNSELSLIAFPTRELFEERLLDFDLIILDRYSYRGILPPHYFDNIARYVDSGGALMVVVGDEYTGGESIAQMPVRAVLPGLPGRNITTDEDYKPTLTGIGRRHPVTRDLPDSSLWGGWRELIGIAQKSGTTLLSANDETPLLVLDDVGEGRVAMMSSGDFWLWARGYQGGGPHRPLMRNLVHWLTKDPALEAETLRAVRKGDKVLITRQTLSPTEPEVTITDQTGKTSILSLEAGDKEGVYVGEAHLEGAADITMTSDDLSARIVPDPLLVREYSRLIASGAGWETSLKSSRGQIVPVFAEGDDVAVPSVRLLDEDARQFSGNGWLGLINRKVSETIGVRPYPLIDGWVALIILTAAIGLLWWRESR